MNKQTKSKGKGYSKDKRNFKSREVDYKDEKFCRKGRSADNDPSWYAENAQLLKDAASIAFPYSVGTPLVPAGSTNVSNFMVLQRSAPGIMTINYRSAPGISVDGVSPINIAARNLYSYVRHANSGSANYDSPDLMLYYLAMDSVYAWYAELCRAYGVARTYSLRNKYMPTAYLKAMGYDAEDIINHLADLRYYINLLCVKIGSMAVPSNSSYMARHIWMNSHIFKDTEGSRFQSYVYVPEGYYHYDEMGSVKGGRLVFEPIMEAKTFEFIQEYSKLLLDPILASEDMGIMSGDILKAFGNNIVTLNPMMEDYTVMPEYSHEVLQQIHNTHLVGSVMNTLETKEAAYIRQDPDTGYILFRPQIMGSELNTMEQILDMDAEFPEPGDVMVATRNMAVTEKVGDDYFLKYVGSDFCTNAGLWYFENEGGTAALTYKAFSSDTTKSINLTDFDSAAFTALMNSMSFVSLLEQFDYHPAVTYNVKANDSEGYTISTIGRCADTCNSTIIADEVLRKMHETAIMSQFNVPSMGAFALSR